MRLIHTGSLAFSLTSWQASASSTPKRDETVLSITAPKAGDTISLGTASERKGINISWTVPEVIASRPVFLSLVQGNNLSSLEIVATINSSTTNNGSYAWRDFTFDSPLVTSYGSAAPSGCNYSIEAKVWTDIVYSGYFTIINGEDGGLNATSICPEPGALLGPANETFPSSASSTSSGSTTGNGGSTQSTTANNTTSKSSSGVSTTTLAVAVVIPIVVLLAAFALIFWLARRRGWFVKKTAYHPDAVAHNYQEKTDSAAPSGRADGYKSVATAEQTSVGELHSDARPFDHAGHEVHEMNGDEERSRYVVRN